MRYSVHIQLDLEADDDFEVANEKAEDLCVHLNATNLIHDFSNATLTEVEEEE
jgi:hypothetical protein